MDIEELKLIIIYQDLIDDEQLEGVGENQQSPHAMNKHISPLYISRKKYENFI